MFELILNSIEFVDYKEILKIEKDSYLHLRLGPKPGFNVDPAQLGLANLYPAWPSCQPTPANVACCSCWCHAELLPDS
jgi:hypothetical protein